ncbi:ABC transporter ATP-binding protein [Candidatus Magnetominusculus xianensis]|uniref:ABC transporter ATP-binding protein n=1 Tax=Candidatus Magnetominusculus xianensis TaxID=1748249 RepID=A0ABR5SEX6_9BACT|nr:ABC transporter ATP-binding protein [Candidatus Magnetominusculus xianensis]KWT82504.1 ABC transporter ATP-binding protein [Candidatus Magnetominusculus xianensis]MBF0405416.1 ABC transporter ATP-binding protein [Nitrospirota bacterium]
MANVLLSIKNLSVSYGNIKALRGISFDIIEGQITALIGANGAGKSSLLRAVSGMVKFDGEINYRGRNIKGMAAHKIVSMGITHVPEGRGIFGSLTVRENLTLAAWLRRNDPEGVKRDYEHVIELFPRLGERVGQLSATLSGGEQQMLAIGRALMSKGDLILLDEPSMGLSPVLADEIFGIIDEISKAGVTILLVEQNAFMALQLSHHGCVMENGELTLEGAAAELLDDPRVRQAYLGV